MRLQKTRSSLDVWLDRGESSEKFWKLVFYFFSRFILVFCVLHYFGVVYPQMGWLFPGPTSNWFWACCVLFTAIFAVVFYVIRGKRKGTGDSSKKDNVKSSPAIAMKQKREGHHGVGRAAFAAAVEEKSEGRRGGVVRAAFASELETAGSELKEERSEDQSDRRE